MTDFLHPDDIDWKLKDDAELWHAAQDGIQQAKDEMARREAKPQRIAQAVKATRVTRKFNH